MKTDTEHLQLHHHIPLCRLAENFKFKLIKFCKFCIEQSDYILRMCVCVWCYQWIISQIDRLDTVCITHTHTPNQRVSFLDPNKQIRETWTMNEWQAQFYLLNEMEKNCLPRRPLWCVCVCKWIWAPENNKRIMFDIHASKQEMKLHFPSKKKIIGT